MELIEQIREKCIEVNPEKNWVKEVVDADGGDVTPSLADILLTLDHSRKSAQAFAVEGSGSIYELYGGDFKEDADSKALATWNLREDDLTKQSPETLAFIAKVLGITS